MKIGVLFPSRVGDPGELLADARALEAAGADSVWFLGTDEGFDQLVALAAIAAVTTELRLGILNSDGGGAGRFTQDRVETLQQISRGRVIRPAERWKLVDVPSDVAAWSRTLAESGDHEGVVVPQDPRLLDMLRNADETVDRSDLQLALG